MRTDKGAALRERLRRGAQSFDFDALIHGVSTLPEDPADEAAAESTPATSATPTEAVPTHDRERLRAALDALGMRLMQEASRLRAALGTGSALDAGASLSRINGVLELLCSIDPEGDAARSLRTHGAPPGNRPWPSPCWSVYEFCESPLSGLLPPAASDGFVHDVFQVAWETARA